MAVAELDRQRERRQRRDATETNEPADDIDVRGCGRELGDRLVERVPSALRIEHPTVALIEDDREWPALGPLPAKPHIVCSRPGSRVVHQPMTQKQLREPMTAHIRSPRASSRARTSRRPDPRRRRDDTADPSIGTRACEPVPRRPRLIDDPNRRRQRLQPPDRRITSRRHPQRPHLTAHPIDHARHHRPSVHIQTDPATFAHHRRLPQ